MLIVLLSCAVGVANSQITKDDWLLGGSISFSSLKNSSTAAVQFSQTNFQISPLIGYFVKDKFAIGINPSYSFGSTNYGTRSSIIGIGPFSRYYFLHTDNIFNLFAEGSYSYGIIIGKGPGVTQKSNTFSISGGPVLYFNTSVGLEFIFGYSTTKVVDFTGRNNEIRAGIGFKFHLEKDK
jgi:hypothetical protein